MEVSVAEAAAVLGISGDTIRRWIARGRLAHRREGNRVVVILDDAEVARGSHSGTVAEIRRLQAMAQELSEDSARLRARLSRAQAMIDQYLEVLSRALEQLPAEHRGTSPPHSG